MAFCPFLLQTDNDDLMEECVSLGQFEVVMLIIAAQPMIPTLNTILLQNSTDLKR